MQKYTCFLVNLKASKNLVLILMGANLIFFFFATKFLSGKLQKNESQAFLLAAQMTSCVPRTEVNPESWTQLKGSLHNCLYLYDSNQSLSHLLRKTFVAAVGQNAVSYYEA